MSEEMEAGCARPTGGPVGEKDPPVKGKKKSQETPTDKEVSSIIMVGKPAPDFTAPAYHQGEFTRRSSPNTWQVGGALLLPG